MSYATLRFHSLTFAFLPKRRGRSVLKSIKTLRVRASRRKFRRLTRSVLLRLNH